MKPRFLLLGLAAASIGLLLGKRDRATATTYPGPACPREGVEVLFVGDSYAVGLAPYLQARASTCGAPWFTSAEVGSNITKWKSRIGPLLAEHRPSHVLFSQGGNDFGRSDPEKVRSDIRSFLDQVRSAGASPAWIGPPETPFPDTIGVREMWAAELWQPGEWHSLDSRELEIPRAPSDPLGHPTQEGYKKWAAWIWPWLSERAGRALPLGIPDARSVW